MTDEVTEAAEQQQAAAQMQVAAEQVQQVAANPAEPVVAAPPPAPEVIPPSIEEVAARRNAENLQRAIEKGGYKPEAEPSRQERAQRLVAEMQHAVDHNAPITQAMMAEVRDLLGAVS